MSSHETDRARRHTARAVLRRIDDETVHQLTLAAEPEAATRRLQELDREWDLDRTIETEAAAMGLAGLALGAFLRPAFLALPAMVGAGVFLFGTIGAYPLLPIFRRLGIRSAREIQRERHALKALRGDFAALPPEQARPAAAPAGPIGDEAPLRH